MINTEGDKEFNKEIRRFRHRRKMMVHMYLKRRIVFFCNKVGNFKQNCIRYKKWKNNTEKTEKASKVEEDREFT